MIIVQRWQEKWRAFSLYRGRAPLVGTLLRWVIWGLRCLLRRPAVVEIPRLALRLHLLPRWKGCWKAIYVFRDRFFEVADPELDLMRGMLGPGDVFVDAGAYHGWYSLVAGGVVGDTGQVLAFEPNPEAYAILERNIALSGRANTRAFNVALAGAGGRVWLYQGPGDGSPSALAHVPGGTRRVEVDARRLDDMLAQCGIDRVTLMKLDVQGAEADVLGGATDVLNRSRPTLFLEVDPWAARNMNVSPRAAWDALTGAGYRFYRFNHGALVALPDFPHLNDGMFVNVIAVPAGH